MPFQSRYGDLEQRLEHLEREFVRLGQSGQNANQQAQGALGSGSGSAAVPVVFAGTIPEAQVVFDDTGGHDHSLGNSTAVPLVGDVTGTNQADTVALLQGITLTLTSPVTGQVLTYNGTAIVNSDTVTGNLTITGVTTTGGFRTAVTAKSADYTLLYTDEFVAVDATTGGKTMTLPTAAGHAGQQLEVKKVDSSANPVTVATTGGQTIDGLATAVLNVPQQSLTFKSTGSNWDIL